MNTNQITTIEVGTVFAKDQAEKFAQRINGQTYMNFQVRVCPIGGSFAVNVETDYPGTEDEIRGMLTYVMFCELNK